MWPRDYKFLYIISDIQEKFIRHTSTQENRGGGGGQTIETVMDCIVFSNIIYWSSDPSVTVFEDRSYKELIKVNWGPKGGALNP